MDQNILPCGQGRIDSVKINTSLIMMKEWCLLLPMAPERDIVTSRFCKHCSQLQECKPCYYLHQHCSALEMRLCLNPLSFWIWCFYLVPHPTIYMLSTSSQWTTPHTIAPVISCHRWCLLLVVLVSLNPKIFRIRCCHLLPPPTTNTGSLTKWTPPLQFNTLSAPVISCRDAWCLFIGTSTGVSKF